MHSIIRKQALELNQTKSLVDYLIPLVGDKKEVKILDIGSGPFPKTGQTLNGVTIEIRNCDKQDFTYFWKELGEVPLFPIEYQDMERLTYPDNYFDIVHCVNALDHTINALAAIKEMNRVVKPSGWIYIDCNLDQRTTSRKKHYWDAKEDGKLVNPTGEIDLKEFGFNIEYKKNAGESHRNQIIGRLRKAHKRSG